MHNQRATVLFIFTIISVYADYKADFSNIYHSDEERELAGDTFIEAFERILDFLSDHNMKGDLESLKGGMYNVSYVYDYFIFRYENDFKECVNNEDSYWEIPIYDSGGEILTVCYAKVMPYFEDLLANGLVIPEENYDEMKEIYTRLGGTWQVFSQGHEIPLEYADILSYEESLKDFISEFGFISTGYIDLVRLPHKVYILYIEEGGIGYAVPITKNQSMPFENGKVYNIADVIEVYKAIYEHNKQYLDLPLEERPLGGPPAELLADIAMPTTVIHNADTNNNSMIIWVPVAIIAALCIALFYRLYYGKRVRQK